VDGRAQFIAEAQRPLSLLSDDNYRTSLYRRLPALGFPRPAAAIDSTQAPSRDSSSRTVAPPIPWPWHAGAPDDPESAALPGRSGCPGSPGRTGTGGQTGITPLVQRQELQESPELTSAALLERWRQRPEFHYIDKLLLKIPSAETLQVATDEVKKACDRLIAEQFPQDRLDELMRRFHLGALNPAEKQELRDLIQKRGSGGAA
jgi:hypothetical protein